MRMTGKVTDYFGANWFYPAFLVLLSIMWLQAKALGTGLPQSWEAALLFDTLVTIPGLFWLCYRGSLKPGAMALRIVALQCSGLWFLGWILPSTEQHVLPTLAPLRSAGLAVIVLVELRLAVALVRIVFKPETKPTDLQSQGVPEWVARAMLIEARFWRWVLNWFKR